MTTAIAPRYAITPDTAVAIGAAIRKGLEALRARPPMRLSEWAAKHFVLASESSHQRGAWVAWPFQVALMDWMSDDDIEELDVFKSKRIGYTKMLTASIGYDAAWRRRNQALWQPTDDDRDSYVKSEVDPMLDPRDGVRAVVDALASGAAEDTIKFKRFLGCVLHLLGGKAARAYRRITVASAKLDEIDGFDRQVEKSADPVTLARGRLEGAPYPKLIVGSTPRLKGLSHIEARAGEALVHMRFHVTCIHCGVEHPLTWGGRKSAFGLKWDNDDEATAHHVCPHCRARITQADYLKHWGGAWVCGVTGARYDHELATWTAADGRPMKAPRHVACYPWSAYSPQREWVDIVREFLAAEKKQAAGDTGPMQGFVNETLGETYADSAEQADQHALMSRREAYPLGTVPVGGLVLVAGVDVQDNRFEVVVIAIGRGEETWVVDHKVFNANPADERDWAVLDAYLGGRFKQAWHGASMGIEAVAIDTGGHFTHQVYNFARLREHRRVFATKGSSIYGGPVKGIVKRVDVNHRGQVIKQGVKLWPVGTDTAKDLLYGRLSVLPRDDGLPAPGCIHFSSELEREFFEQLTAEGRVLQRTAVGEVFRWIKLRARNEALDCFVLCLFCIQVLDLHRYTDAMWQRLEGAVQPPRDLFTPTQPAPAPGSVEGAEPRRDFPHPPPQRRGSFGDAPTAGSTPGVPRGWN
jgi:phage terminase large subunit GpA-like protein